MTQPVSEHVFGECTRLVDVVTDRRLYGTSGQKQHGIDIYARLTDGTRAVYQVRDIKALTPQGLRKAVEDFIEGNLPFTSRRFVLCVACQARNTETLEELEHVRDKYSSHREIDLYDEQKLSDLLHGQPIVVERFFGAAWRDLFCDVVPSTRQTQMSIPAGPTADELLRGPVRSLGLNDQLKEAEGSVVGHPAHAAELFNLIARRLYDRGFAAHSRMMRERQAKALEAAGDFAAAFDCWFELARADVEEGALTPHLRGLRELSALSEHLTNAEQARVTALDAYAHWHENPIEALPALREGAETLLAIGDSFAARAWLWLTEAILVDNAGMPLGEIASTAKGAAAMSSDEATSIRLYIAVADNDGEWNSLLRSAGSGRLAPELSALVHQRYGRWLAWHAEPEGAEDAYRRAVEAATAADLPGDVVQALNAIRAVRQFYGPLDQETLTISSLTRAVKGTRTCVGGRFDPERIALEHLYRGSKPDALFELRRYLWEARIGGHFAAEIQAHEFLGSLYAASGVLSSAIRHFLRAGRDEKAAEAAACVTEVVELQDEIRSEAPWERASALAVVASQADVLSTESVAFHVPLLVMASAGVPQSPFGAQVSVSAMKALAELATRIPDDLVPEVLDVFEPLVDHPPTSGGFIRQEIPQTFAAIIAMHPRHRERAARLLMSCLDQEFFADPGRMALRWLGPLARLLIPDLRRLADHGNRTALDTLADLHDSAPTVLAEARRRVDGVLRAEPPVERAQWSLGGVDAQASVYALLLSEDDRAALARKWLRLAQDSLDLAFNRSIAIDGIACLAHYLPDTLRTQLFDEVIALADAGLPVSEVDKSTRQSQHPLSRFRLNIGTGDLPRSAARACALLATTADQARRVIETIAMWLRSADDQDLAAVAQSLTLLDRSLAEFDLRFLVGHQSSLIRRAAVQLWSQDPQRDGSFAEKFVTDADRDVRAALASQLRTISENDSSTAASLYSRLSQDGSALVRRLAEANCPDYSPC
jgi:hypothetical protein